MKSRDKILRGAWMLFGTSDSVRHA